MIIIMIKNSTYPILSDRYKKQTFSFFRTNVFYHWSYKLYDHVHIPSANWTNVLFLYDHVAFSSSSGHQWATQWLVHRQIQELAKCESGLKVDAKKSLRTYVFITNLRGYPTTKKMHYIWLSIKCILRDEVRFELR